MTCPSKPNGSITRPTTTTRSRSSPNWNATSAWSSDFVGGSGRRMSAVPTPPSERKHPKASTVVPIGDEAEVVWRQKPRGHEGSEEPHQPDADARAIASTTAPVTARRRTSGVLK